MFDINDPANNWHVLIDEADTRYDRLTTILAKLDREQLVNGYRTFDARGVEKEQSYDTCFVARVYGDEGALSSMGYIDVRLAHVLPQLTSCEKRYLSSSHYHYPEEVKAVCDMLLFTDPVVTA
jgi:hypothetical protein